MDFQFHNLGHREPREGWLGELATIAERVRGAGPVTHDEMIAPGSYEMWLCTYRRTMLLRRK